MYGRICWAVLSNLVAAACARLHCHPRFAACVWVGRVFACGSHVQGQHTILEAGSDNGGWT